MTDELRHDSRVQETQLAHYRRQPPSAQRWECVERAALGRQHPLEPRRRLWSNERSPASPSRPLLKDPHPSQGHKKKWLRPPITTYSQWRWEHTIHSQSFQKQKTETKREANHHSEVPSRDSHGRCRHLSLSSVWCGHWRTEQMTEQRKVKRNTKSTAGQSCVNPTWTRPELWGLSELQELWPRIKWNHGCQVPSEPGDTGSTQHVNDNYLPFTAYIKKQNKTKKPTVKMNFKTFQRDLLSRWSGVGEWKKGRHTCWGNFKPLTCKLLRKQLEKT